MAAASPADNDISFSQAKVELLSAKIGNAIADLPESKTQLAIQNATFFVLAKEEAPFGLKVAAIEDVIGQADLIGDTQVVKALEAIDLGVNNVKDTDARLEPKTVSQKQRTALISTPPSTASKGGSDY